MTDPVEKARLAWIGALHRFETAVKADVGDEDYRRAKAELEEKKRAYDRLLAEEGNPGQGKA
jgi:hypothetical protein